MHPLDTQRNINWIIHLIGKVMIATWLGVVIAGVVGAATEVEALTVFVTIWPLALGVWLVFSNAPFPQYLSEEEIALAADNER